MTTYEYHRDRADGFIKMAVILAKEMQAKQEDYMRMLNAALYEARAARKLRREGEQVEVPSDAGSGDSDSGSPE